TTDFPGFTSLAADRLACVTDTFALIRLWFAQLANSRGDLTNLLLVDTAHTDLSSFGCSIDAINIERNTVGRSNLNRMGVTHQDNQIVTNLIGTITDAMDLQLFSKSGCHSDNHIIDQSTIKTMFRLMLFTIRRS